MRTAWEIADSIKALDSMMKKMDYSTTGQSAFSSGELYGMRNVLCWVLGEDVASPKQTINQVKRQLTHAAKCHAND